MWWRELPILILAASLSVAIGCLEIPKHSVCTSGLICPPPLQCAAAQDICIADSCGNGATETPAGETCDDGNIEPGDGCDQECQSETTCGNSVIEIGEECDDGGGNHFNCDSNCTLPDCGDGWSNLHAGEECDEGNPLDTYTCVACKRSRMLAIGGFHTCMLLDDGSVRCWGFGTAGQLGHGNTADIGDDETPASVGSVYVGGSVIQIAAGGLHTCALLYSGTVRCWGHGYAGRLGYGNTALIGDDEAPASAGDVDVGGSVIQIAAGGAHTCALLDSGTVRCWGLGQFGRLGHGNTKDIGDDETPASAGDVDVGGSVIQIVAGNYHTCALLGSGIVRCWGRGHAGRLGHGNMDSIGDDEAVASTVDVDVGGSVIQLAAGGAHTCALLDYGTVRCWGSGYYGQLGYGNMNSIGDDETPASAGDVDLGGTAVQIAAGYEHTCALLATGAIRCWGYGYDGQLGYGNQNSIGDDETPASAGDVDVGGRVFQITTGGDHTCVVLDTGAVRCWGYGAFGQLGYGNTNIIGDNEHPAAAGNVSVGGSLLSSIASVEVLEDLLDASDAQCWSDEASGQL